MPTSGPRLTLRKSSCPMIPMLRRFRACWICQREDRSRRILYTMGAKNDGNGLTCPSLSVHSIHRRGVIIVSFFFDVLIAMCLDPVNRTTWGRQVACGPSCGYIIVRGDGRRDFSYASNRGFPSVDSATPLGPFGYEISIYHNKITAVPSTMHLLDCMVGGLW